MATRHMAAGALALLLLATAGAATAQMATLQAIRTATRGPFLDPEAAFWQQAPAVTVAMLPQTITTPSDPTPAVSSLNVKAAHDGRWFAVLLEWADATRSDRIVVDQFGDQVAVEFPLVYEKDALPSPMMGNTGRRVEIWQWRAAFQADLARGRPVDTHDLYPNAHVDVYPDQVLQAIDTRPYMGAVGVDNLITRAGRSPVLEQVAEGWGTLTIEPEDQQADGKGVWRDGVWRVVLTHPMKGGDGDVRFVPGEETAAAFAVWDGGSGEVGPRKAWATWITVELAR
ncbi:MAG: hypothetical protein B6D46_09010 [Polyangiaceae bacterium UTPRO1]|nr:ethylbenzene dehydrogenase-related protein [Myxococcales bacterium]OQY66863.1 MAG: hypothetical protein B6D46_09010 [Polyangiaceae bacterium UTPRO1]